MQEDIRSITFSLENCEIIKIDGKFIGKFNLKDINYNIERVACNSIMEFYTAKHFSISINRDANTEEPMLLTLGGVKDETRKPLERILSHHDLVCVEIEFWNGQHKTIYVPWGQSDFTNEFQTSYMNPMGDLFIIVDEKLEFKDVFDIDEIDDSEHMDFEWAMYS